MATHEPAAALNDRAVQYQAEGKFREAEQLYKESQSVWETSLGADHPLVAQSLNNRASLYRQMGELHEAERLLQIALRIWRRRGFPTAFEDTSWAETLGKNHVLKNLGAQARGLRAAVSRGEAPARAELNETIRQLSPWYHNVEFAPGFVTNPSTPDYPASRWRVLDEVIPKDLRGKTVLDIGCNSGFFSLEMKKRGASRVVGIDIMPHLLAQSRFASHWFELPLELYELGAYDVDQLEETFDVVVFIGVLYHLRHPLYALEKIAALCKETMYFQSVVRGNPGDITPADNYPANETAVFDDPAWPKLYFIEKSFNGDESNWWLATRSCLKAMLRVAGFRGIEDTASPDIFVCGK